MLSPALPIAGGGEEFVDQTFVGAVFVRLVVLGKSGGFVRGGGQTGQIELEPANQFLRTGFRRWREALGLKFGEDEGVDGS